MRDSNIYLFRLVPKSQVSSWKGIQMVILEHKNLIIQIDELDGGKRKILLRDKNQSNSPIKRTWITAYPTDLIRAILDVKGSDLIEDIQREEDKASLEWILKTNLFSYVDPKLFENKKILDYGCGTGTSTLVLARLFPRSKIVGTDVIKKFLSIAELRKKYYSVQNCNFILTSTNSPPSTTGNYDFIILSAVYEHLLPLEREVLLTQMWEILNPKGFIFIFDTPNRLFPIEIHTTGLPLINYLPDHITEILARRWSKKIDPNVTWEFLLRCGIRGSTLEEILKTLKKLIPGQFLYLRPNRLGIKHHIDLWYVITKKYVQSNLGQVLLRILMIFLRFFYNLSGVFLGHSISFAIKKLML